MKKQRYTMRRGVIVLFIMLVLMLAIAIISVNSGKMNLSPGEVLNVIFKAQIGKT